MKWIKVGLEFQEEEEEEEKLLALLIAGERDYENDEIEICYFLFFLFLYSVISF